jgi:hypothetical protein
VNEDGCVDAGVSKSEKIELINFSLKILSKIQKYLFE